MISALWGAIGFADRDPGLPAVHGRGAARSREAGLVLEAAAARGPATRTPRGTCWWTAAPAPTPRLGRRRAGTTVAVNVFTEAQRQCARWSRHFAKHTRGELARHLLTRRGKAPETPAAAAEGRAGKVGRRNWWTARRASRTR